ncbi:PTS sugar transporter subunit IIA [uncultured Marinococcus sp.]|uniref:PTS sugar transporter subunit IIA n=1 Tax=uncultured Marinococcus sp. TaxID=487012 RepID=UPI0026170B7D|nr:PTS sugar transporter subunit IIA [uncultured Marinococcus sp.]
MKFLPEEMINVQHPVSSPEEAIRAAGDLLEKEKTISSSYKQAMVEAYISQGAYFVLAPGVAVPHARPQDGALESAISFVQLEEPVVFGHSTNDPVTLIFGLSAASNDEHLHILQKLTMLLNDPSTIEQMKEARNVQDITKIIQRSGMKK